MVIIKKESWYIIKGHKKPTIECPNCGVGLLGDPAPHRIYPDGTVKASVICYNCQFHDFIKLEDWNGCKIE